MKITSRGKEVSFRTFKFNGGEIQVSVSPVGEDEVSILQRIRSSDDLMELLLVVESLQIDPKNIAPTIPYLPYARQDRRMVSGESFSLKVFCNLINGMNLGQVRIFDPHSDVGPALLNNCIILSNENAFSEFTEYIIRDFIFVSPDAGAYKKTSKLAQIWNREIVVATKTRDVANGVLGGVSICGDVKGKHCVIVDDICDGGRTFINLGSELLNKGASQLSLFVSHGIFSAGYSDLFKIFQNIGTTNSFKPYNEFPEGVKVINITH